MNLDSLQDSNQIANSIASPVSAAPTSAPSSHQDVLNYYRAQLQEQQQILQRSLQSWRWVAYLRGGSFLVALIPLALGLGNYANLATIWYFFAGLLFLSFLAIAFVHENLHAKLRRANLVANMHRESIARCQRNWKEIQVPPAQVPLHLNSLSADLDLFTDSSLYKLLATPRTAAGIATLRSWLIEGAEPAEVVRRQAAVAELKPDFDWRLNFRISCELLGSAKAAGFVEWAESPNWLNSRRWVLWLSRLTGLLSLGALLGLLSGLTPAVPSLLTLLATCGINFLLSVLFAGSFHDIFNQVSTRSDEALHYVNLFDSVARYPARCEKLRQLQRRLKDASPNAQTQMQQLGRLTSLANIRRSGLLFIPYLALEFLCFWDVHCLDLLESWKRKNGSQVRGWFEDLGEWEVLCALAKLAGDHPEWTFPQVVEPGSEGTGMIEARQLGHPLLNHQRVCNDVTVGPPGTVLLVTGSNMSGKSTLLRSIGANVVLAQMGSVVCAQSMRLSPLRIETSMRIADSLADGVSFFMAELKRLKEVVDAAQQIRQKSGRTMLFLLDEILQGTNSQERQIAVSRVVRKLIDEQAIGAISTHDLDLATTPELREACHTVHFSEQFSTVDGKQQMTFDYQMRPGISTSTNALKLLEMVGLK
jgi:ABC-type multidrug transport system fused ATPase/permease subunit